MYYFLLKNQKKNDFPYVSIYYDDIFTHPLGYHIHFCSPLCYQCMQQIKKIKFFISFINTFKVI